MSFGGRSNGCDFTPARVCEEDVDVTVLLFHDGIEPIQILQARNVASDRRDVLTDRGCGLFQLFLASAADYNVRAFFNEALGCGQANPAVTACNDCNFPFKLSHTRSLDGCPASNTVDWSDLAVDENCSEVHYFCLFVQNWRQTWTQLQTSSTRCTSPLSVFTGWKRQPLGA